jgi:GWxTD domain-containing protein
MTLRVSCGRAGAPRPWSHWDIRALLLCGLLVAASLPAGAGDEDLPGRATHGQRPAFSARVVPLLEEQRALAALHVEVPYQELGFRKVAGGGMVAEFDLIVLILLDGRQIEGDLYSERIEVASREALYGRRARYSRELLFPLAPGCYRIEVALSEPSSGHEGRLALGVCLDPVFPGQLRLAPLLLGECGLTGRVADLFFDPRIRTEFVDPRGPLCVYTELFHPNCQPEEIELHWVLSREIGGGEALREGTLRFPPDETATRLHWSIDLADLWLETYRIDAVVRAAGRRARGSATFGLLVESEEALDRFFLESLEVLAYIASSEELQRLEMAAPDERRAEWDAFWQRRDPTPLSEENEYKAEFFDRLRYANSQFGGARAGWQTDRGHVYIVHGEPDLIDRRTFQLEGPPTEIWHYDRLGLRFVFVDRTGYGDYTLVDDAW